MLNNELNYLIRQPLFWLSALIFLCIAGIVSYGAPDPDTLGLKLFYFKSMTMLMLGVPLLCAAIAPLCVLRDSTSNMTELVLATPQTNVNRTWIRFAALNLVIFTLCVLANTLIAFLVLGPLAVPLFDQLQAMVWSLALLYLPSVLFCTSLCMWLASRFNSVPVIYFASGLLWGGYMTLASMSGITIMAGSVIANTTLLNTMLVLDPFGLSAVFAQFRDAKTIPTLDLTLIVNRLVYVCIAAGLMFFTLTCKQPLLNKTRGAPRAFKFRFALPFSFTLNVQSPLLQLTLSAIKMVLFSRLNQLVLLFWCALIFSEVLAGIDYLEPMSQKNPTSLDAWARVAYDIVPAFGAVLIAFWLWQMCFRDSLSKMAELIASTHTSNLMLSLSRVIAAWVLIAVLLTLCAASVLLAEWYAHSEVLPLFYLKQCALVALPLMILSVVFVALFTVIRSPISAGLAVFLLFIVKLTPVMVLLGFAHPFWDVAGLPLQAADFVWGFGASLHAYVPFAFFWGLIACCLFLLSNVFSHRGTGLQVTQLRLLAFKQKAVATALFAATVLIGFLFHHLLIAERPLLHKSDQHAWRAAYETQYGEWQKRHQPSLTHLKVKGDFYPSLGSVDFKLTYTLKNRTNEAIFSLLLSGVPGYHYDDVTLSKAATYFADTELNQHVFTLAEPLLPDEALTLDVAINYQQARLWPVSLHHIVSPEFSYVRSAPLLPHIGFNPDFKLIDSATRLKFGLDTLNRQAPSELAAHAIPRPRTHIHSIMTTDKGFYLVAPGTLITKNEQNNRVTAEFKTQVPTRPIAAWFSLPYEALTDQSDDTQLYVYAPSHEDSLTQASAQITLNAMADTLAWFNAHISPYKGKRLNMIAAPDLGFTGYALPHSMMIAHGVGFRAEVASSHRGNPVFDQRYRRAVHETAHQWFGHDIGYGLADERAFLVESLAKYVELVLLLQYRGESERNALVQYEYQRYRNAMANMLYQPVPLIHATHAFDMYSRATLVFYILQNQVGDEAITNALSSLWQSHLDANLAVRSLDFVAALKTHTDKKHHGLIDLLFLSNDVAFLLEHPDFKHML